MTGRSKPEQAIRRFDVFAEYNRLEAVREGRPADEAKGHGIWLAKLVAGRRGRTRTAPSAPRAQGDGHVLHHEPALKESERFKSVGGVPQTDDVFDREVIDRMGEDFYREVFAPELARRFERGDRYEAIRDTVRKEWKP